MGLVFQDKMLSYQYGNPIVEIGWYYHNLQTIQPFLNLHSMLQNYGVYSREFCQNLENSEKNILNHIFVTIMCQEY